MLGDHALLDVSQIESFHKKLVTVRTKSGENLSQDSMVCQIPDDLLKFQTHRKVSTSFIIILISKFNSIDIKVEFN